MSGWSFDPSPSNGGHHPNSKDCPLFFSLLFGDSFSQLHHLCLAIKAARHHFVALLYSKTCNWYSLLCLAAKECSLLDKGICTVVLRLCEVAVGSCSAQGQSVRLCDLRDPFWLCPGNIFKHKLHDCDIFSQDSFSCWQLYLTLQIFWAADPPRL